MEADGRIVKRPWRVSETMADLEVQHLTIGANVEQRPGQSGGGGVGRFRVRTFVQVKQNRTVEPSAFVGDDEIDAGQVIELAAPDANELRNVLTCR
jgi:hypothetical protein